jgi:hypothetical protein
MPARFPLAALTAALLALPVASLAQAPGSAPPGQSRGATAMRPAFLLGLEDGDGPAALSLRFDAEFPQRALAPDVGFSIVASVGYSHRSDEATAFDYRWEQSLGIFKLVPAARFTFGSHAIRPYADVGLGLYRASWSFEETEYWGYPYYGDVTTRFEDSELGLMLRLAGGISFQVNERFGLGAEIGFSPYLGDVVDDTTFNLMAAATFRF